MKQFFAFCLLIASARGADYINQQVLLLDAGKGLSIDNSGSGGANRYTFQPAMAAGHRVRLWMSSAHVPNYQIESVTAGNPTTIRYRNNLLANGTSIILQGFTGSWAGLNGAHTVANVDGLITAGVSLNTFTVAVDTTGLTGALGRPVIEQTCSDPCLVTMNRNWFGGAPGNPVGGGHGYYEELDASGNPLSPVKMGTFRIPGVEPPMAPCVFPLEVVGQDGFVYRCTFSVAAGKPATSLWSYFRINNHTYNRLMPAPDQSQLGFDTKFSYQICQGSATTTCTSWLDINNTTTTSLDESKWFGLDMAHSIAGPINTVEVRTRTPDYAILANSTNNVAIRFNGTEGVTSGGRFLDFNLLDSTTNTAMSQIAVASNVATATATGHPFSTNDWLMIYLAPGMHARFNSSRKVTGTATNAFTFIPCTAGAPNILGIFIRPAGCTSPNGTFSPPTSYASTYDVTAGSVLANFPQVAQPVMYAVREVIDPSAYIWDDPSTYAAPSGGDATRGAKYLTSRDTLHVSGMPWVDYKFKAACSDCHFDNANRADSSMVAGQDLAYFRFSNSSIIARSMMHDYTESQGKDIAAAVRAINNSASPATARLWNPPMTPCPGMEAAGQNGAWLAGCGIDAIVTYDQDLCEYYVPGCINGIGGNYSGWNMATGDVGVRDKPVLSPHQDWLHYPPLIHPADAYPASNFFSMDGSQAVFDPYAYYVRMRTALQPQTLAVYALGTFCGGYFNTQCDPLGIVNGQAPYFQYE